MAEPEGWSASAGVEFVAANCERLTLTQRGPIVVKVGGSIQDEAAQLQQIMDDVITLRQLGGQVVVVHGGGKAINAAVKDAGLTPTFVKGQRYTDGPTLAIAERVLAEVVNAQLVSMIQRSLGGVKAAGLHSLGTCVLFAERAIQDGVDLGFVGEVRRVDTDALRSLMNAQTVPVIGPISMDIASVPPAQRTVDKPGKLNVNADLAAGVVAAQLEAGCFVLVSDTPGVRSDPRDAATAMASMNRAEFAALRASGAVDGGMLPKLRACFDALEAVPAMSVSIIDGRLPRALLAAVIEPERTPGTRVTL